MEQPCYKCGQVVVEGRPFCPHCFAPQIRVVVAEPVAAPVAAVHAGSSQDDALPASETVPVLAVPMGWSQAAKPAALAAGVGMILMAFRMYPFVAMLVMGFLATVFYRQGQPSAPIKTAIGMRLGALSGLFASGFMTLLSALGTLIPDLRDKLHEKTIEYFQQSAASQPGNPQFQALLEQLKTPEGYIAIMIALGVLLLVLSIVLGSLGGAVGAAILGRRARS